MYVFIMVDNNFSWQANDNRHLLMLPTFPKQEKWTTHQRCFRIANFLCVLGLTASFVLCRMLAVRTAVTNPAPPSVPPAVQHAVSLTTPSQHRREPCDRKKRKTHTLVIGHVAMTFSKSYRHSFTFKLFLYSCIFSSGSRLSAIHSWLFGQIGPRIWPA